MGWMGCYEQTTDGIGISLLRSKEAPGISRFPSSLAAQSFDERFLVESTDRSWPSKCLDHIRFYYTTYRGVAATGLELDSSQRAGSAKPRCWKKQGIRVGESRWGSVALRSKKRSLAGGSPRGFLRCWESRIGLPGLCSSPDPPTRIPHSRQPPSPASHDVNLDDG
jgi:hypothetical protein